jgi:hypothetical protein
MLAHFAQYIVQIGPLALAFFLLFLLLLYVSIPQVLTYASLLGSHEHHFYHL